MLNYFKDNLSSNEIKIENLDKYLSDYRQRYFVNNDFILEPRSLESIKKILYICNNHNIAITIQSGNTSLCGASVPFRKEKSIILSMNNFNKLININLVDNAITVESGMILKDLQDIAKNNNRFFPLNLASNGSCQIGGNIATNAGGLNVLRYGTMRDLVLGLEVILPNGKVLSHLEPLHKNSTGYDLKHLFIGSEGTLGVIIAATLKLFPLPKYSFTFLLSLDNLNEATKLYSILKQEFFDNLSSFELMNHDSLSLSSSYLGLDIPIEINNWYLLCEITSYDDLSIEDKIITILLDNNFPKVLVASNNSQREELWKLRESISPAQKKYGYSIKHDIGLSIASINKFIELSYNELSKYYREVKLVIFGHLGDGSLHYNVFLNNKLDLSIYEYEKEINAIVYDIVLKLNGTISAEHGIGRLKKQYLAKYRTIEEIKIMKGIKKVIDPNNIMNPNILFDS